MADSARAASRMTQTQGCRIPEAFANKLTATTEADEGKPNPEIFTLNA